MMVEWLGWACTLVAIGIAILLWRRLTAERAHAHEVLCEKIDAENRIDELLSEQSAMADTQPLFVPVADRLDGCLQATRAEVERAAAEVVDYREHVVRFDSAVQYCLQPVEMIFGADKASLDQLVHHVEGARRKLFEARASLVKHALHSGVGALDAVRDDVNRLGAVAGDVREGKFAVARAATPVEANPTTTEPLEVPR